MEPNWESNTGNADQTSTCTKTGWPLVKGTLLKTPGYLMMPHHKVLSQMPSPGQQTVRATSPHVMVHIFQGGDHSFRFEGMVSIVSAEGRVCKVLGVSKG